MSGASGFIVLVIADGAFSDGEVVQQLLCVPRIFAGNQVNFFQDPQGSQGDVFEVADRRSHHVQARRQRGDAIFVLR